MTPRLHMPPLDGGEWVNSDPLGLPDLRDRVVLVNFWTLTCINWLRQEPYVRAWARAYRDDGLVVIGVHTPEFSFEHEADLVRRAVKDRDIDYPVVIDNDYAIWSAFDNNYWPALYFVDREGVIRDEHFGEGRYERSERELQSLLGLTRASVAVQGAGVEAEADWRNLRTPETYVGYRRSANFGSPEPVALDEVSGYTLPADLRLNHWALAGDWTIGRENVALHRAGGGIAFRFHARDVHLVLSPGTSGPVPFQVRIDGEPPRRSHGADVDEEGHGVLVEGRLYQLVREHERVRERTVQIAFHEPGAAAYSFTFG